MLPRYGEDLLLLQTFQDLIHSVEFVRSRHVRQVARVDQETPAQPAGR